MLNALPSIWKSHPAAASGRGSRAWLIVLVVAGVFYVGHQWTPSSYGMVLAQLGEPEAGLSFGVPRPIRSDEWGVATPLLQATINNEFRRFNETSVYKEDLRMNFGLPIADWGLIFKPTMWGYFVIPPGAAFSLHWYLLFAAFTAGYALLFKRMGFTTGQAVSISLGLYFTGFVQFWWNEKGSEFALFPWLILPLLSSRPDWIRLGLFFWASTSWLLTNFYPPIQVSLAFVGGVIVLAFGKEWLEPKRLSALCATSGLAALTAALYFRDYLLATAATVYPGQRSVGGGGVPNREWLTHFFPYLMFDWQYDNLGAVNLCEGGTLAIAFSLMACVFLRHRDLASKLAVPSEQRRRIVVVALGLAAMTAWMLLPLRPWMGMPFLWNHVPATRMVFAFGLLFVLLVCLLAQLGGLVVTATRLALYVAVVLIGWWGFKEVTAENALLKSNDLVVIPVMLVLLGIGWRRHRDPMSVMLAASASCGVLALFAFNPLQSAAPIFSHAKTLELRKLDAEASMSGGVLAISGWFGAVLNGLGYRSIAHTTPTPALEFWRRRYPDMPANEFNRIFNRYSHVLLRDIERPTLLSPDSVGVPVNDVQTEGTVLLTAKDVVGSKRPARLEQGQKMSGRFTAPRTGTLEGFGIEIGHGAAPSDGVLSIELCDGTQCAQGRRDLVESIDRFVFRLPLDDAFKVRSGDLVRFELSLAGGSRAVALPTFEAPDSSSNRVVIDTDAGPALPRVRLQYSTAASNDKRS